MSGNSEKPPVPSLVEVERAWAQHPLGKQRAQGGRWALGGFHYQLGLSLEQFFDHLERRSGQLETAFEGLSDLALRDGSFDYLVQVKRTLRRDSVREAVAEMLAIDRFLEQVYPELRPRIRFCVWCRRRATPAEPSQMSAEDLGLDDAAAQRWREIVQRVEPVEVRPDPMLALVVRFHGRLQRPFSTLEALQGRLVRLLADGLDSRQISDNLLDLWESQLPPAHKPPGRLLTNLDFQPTGAGQSEQAGQSELQVGDRPIVEDVAQGCFMPRQQRLVPILEALDTVIADGPGRGRPRQQLDVVWIEGASGVGKSVLLLQTLEELVSDRQWVVHCLDPSASGLVAALAFWSPDSVQVVLAVDDLFAPTRRQAESWQQVHQMIRQTSWTCPPVILTCGPNDYREACEREAQREGTLRLHTVVIDPLYDDERLAYGQWFGCRTNSGAAEITQTNFATAAFLLALKHRGERPDLGQFARRLADRFQAQGLEDELLTLLASEILGVRLPPRLFKRDPDFRDLLIDERLLHQVPGQGALRMLHPRLARQLYRHLVLPQRRHDRSRHVLRCFELLRTEGVGGTELLGLLPATSLSLKARELALVGIAQQLIERPPGDSEVALIGAWWNSVQAIDWKIREVPGTAEGKMREVPGTVRKAASNLRTAIQGWLDSRRHGPAPRGQLLQMAWDLSADSEKDALRHLGQTWLRTHHPLDEWNYIWQALWKHRPSDDLETLALRWLEDAPHQRGWSYVFQALFDHREGDTARRLRGLRAVALPGLRHSPFTPVDPHVWRKVWDLSPEPREFVDQLMLRLANCPFPHLQREGLDFLQRLRHQAAVGSPLDDTTHWIDGFTACHDQPMWPYLLQHPKLLQWMGDELLSSVCRWLEGAIERVEWHYVWQAWIVAYPGDERLIQLGRDALERRRDDPEWAYIWSQLVNAVPEDSALLADGTSWLNGRQEWDQWSHVWQQLARSSPSDEVLQNLALDWLQQQPNHPSWTYVWRDLKTYRPEDLELLDMAQKWLPGREDNVSWSQVWRGLLGSEREDEALVQQGMAWLRRHPQRADWNLVWQDLAVHDPSDAELFESGQRWLQTADEGLAAVNVRQRLQAMQRLRP